MSAILKKRITFFWSKLCKLHKKDPILHVATTFSLKQGETWTSHGPIPHPLKRPTVASRGFLALVGRRLNEVAPLDENFLFAETL